MSALRAWILQMDVKFYRLVFLSAAKKLLWNRAVDTLRRQGEKRRTGAKAPPFFQAPVRGLYEASTRPVRSLYEASTRNIFILKCS